MSTIREDGFEQLIDGVGISLESNKPFLFKCCDCGLIHKMVIVTEKDEIIGFAVERVVIKEED